MDSSIMNFPITVYGNAEQFTPTISKARLRIFYKYGNRNGTYITDEFAEKLIATLPYAPVKGIYTEADDDFSDHGEKRSLGRIYGVVPADPNFAWEDHEDEDGVTRTYACVDAFLYTALYTEANVIVGKGQSMELYAPSIKGDWQIIDGKRYYVFTEGSFLGLQVLGDSVEPCFEGASFYELRDQFQSLLDEMGKYAAEHQQSGGNKMPQLTFKISDDQKYEYLWSLLNPNFSEAGNWQVDCQICAVYDEYAVVRNFDGTYDRVYYAKDDASDSVTINEKKKCYILDITEDEKMALETLRALNGNTYEHMNENYMLVSEHDSKIVELNDKISTLQTEQENSQAQVAEMTQSLNFAHEETAAANAKVAELTAQNEELSTYKHNIEHEQKTTLLGTYATLLSEDSLAKFGDEVIDAMTYEELDMKLAYEYKLTHPAMFAHTPTTPLIPVDSHDDEQAHRWDCLKKFEKH